MDRLSWPAVLAVCLSAVITACAVPVDPPGTVPLSNPGSGGTDALLYTGAGTWMPEIDSIARILYEHGATYQRANSEEFNAMSLDQLRDFRVLVVPGGSAAAITQSLTVETRARLREAVQQVGVNFLGFCAGAWIAFAPRPAPGQDVAYGIGVAEGPVLESTSMERDGKHYLVLPARLGDGHSRQMLWYGGPITPEIPGGVVARYPDGKPAITQVRSGKGLVVASGFHPAATQYVLNDLGLKDPDGQDYDFAWQMLDAAIHDRPMPAF
jgi:glutamine amidotransferase-like uncharacterized protein